MIKSSGFAFFTLAISVTIGLLQGSARAQVQTQPQLEKVIIDNRATVTGLRETDSFGTTYYSFRGIPYAEPPIGEKRWKDPVLRPANTLNGYSATRYRSKCAQWSRSERTSGMDGSEDCLFLNIFTRNLPDVSGIPSASRPARPVIFYVHGGGFMYSSGEAGGPSLFLRHKDVVLVTFNYRLGVFGFLSTNDTSAPGNYALLDQILALEWVNKYIKYFGGDIRRITIMGTSAGAAAAHALTLSPLAKDLFSGAILQSGSTLCDWAIQARPYEYASEIGRAVNCSWSDSEPAELVRCLRSKDASDLIQAQTDKLEFWVLPLGTAPVVDAGLREFPVLPAHPEVLMSTADYAKVPMIVGVTKDEGLMGYAFLHLHEVERFNDDEYFHAELVPKVVRNIFGSKTESEVQTIARAVDSYYFQGVNVNTYQGSQKAITEMTNLFGDSMFYSCHWNLMEKLAAASAPNIYSYMFSYKRPRSPKILGQVIPRLRRVRVQHPLFDSGVSHGEDMFYFFHPMLQFSDNNQELMNDQDMEMAEVATKLWVSFASDRVPNVAEVRQQYPPWRPLTATSMNYYELSGNRTEMGTDFRKGEALFWLRSIPLLQSAQQEIDELEAVPYQILFWILLALSIFFLIVVIVLICMLYRKRRTGKATL